MKRASSAAVWMLFAACTGAAQAACVHALNPRCDWRVVVLFRVVIGLGLALVLLRASGARMPRPTPRGMWVRSVAGSIAFLCTFYGAAHIPVADAVVLINTTPIWITLLSVVVLGHRLNASVGAALVVGTAGIVLLTQPHFAHRNLGALAALGTGVLASISLLAINRLRHVHPLAIVVHATAAAVVTSTAVVVLGLDTIAGGFWTSPVTLGLLVVTAILGTLTQIGQTRAYASGHAGKVAPLQYVGVAFAAGLDFLIFGYRVSPLMLAGFALIAGPAIWLILHPAARSKAVTHTHDLPVSGAPDLTRLEELVQAIRVAEKRTSCEVRVHVEATSSGATRPREVFDSLGMEATKLRNGVLVYLALESRVFAIVADHGIADVVPERVLEDAAAAVRRRMEDGDVIRAVADGIVEVFTLLGKYYPYQKDDANELPDEISVGAGF